MDGDDSIKALAEKIPQVQSGGVSVTVTAADTAFVQAVTFPFAFPGVPIVVLGAGSPPAAAGYSLAIWQTNATATGFNINVKRSNITGTNVYWVAVGAAVSP